MTHCKVNVVSTNSHLRYNVVSLRLQNRSNSSLVFIRWLCPRRDLGHSGNSVFSKLHIAFQGANSPGGTWLRADHIGVERTEHNRSLLRASNEHIQATLSALTIDTGKPLKVISLSVRAIGHRDKDNVSFIPLDIFQ